MGGELGTARIAVYFSGSSDVQVVDFYWQVTEGPNGCQQSEGNVVDTFCNDGTETWYCLSHSDGAECFELF
jgi:hypothetical protein